MTNPTKGLIKNLIAWTEINFIYENLILNGLTVELYDYYTTISTAKEVWDALSKKYTVSRYLQYQITDDRSVEAQSHEIQKTGHEISSEGISIDDQFQDAVIIDKLPQLWKDFKNTIRNKTKEATRRHDQKEEVNTISRTQSTAILKPNL